MVNKADDLGKPDLQVGMDRFYIEVSHPPG
jgi:hypothetical protein